MPQEAPMPGFNFENCKRNAMLAAQGFKPPKVVFLSNIKGRNLRPGALIFSGTLFLELL